ncbi:MAG: TIGR00266 family protein [Cystobacterineae bacterium]|nr:TIGR00266 family protein [Cystobacterineae bacterium]
MNYKMTQSTAFPLVEVTLARGEEIQIERGSMVYHSGGVSLEGKMNTGGGGGGLGGFFKAVGRSMVSGESFFVTHAKGLNDGACIALAPSVPGAIRELKLGESQWRIRDQAFLACDGGVSYAIKRQSFGKAMFGGTGGFFIMETQGTGSMLINSYGDLHEVNLSGSAPFVVDNTHVVAWSTTLDYNIKVASGTFGFATGEGLVNEFHGHGTIFIQTRNIQSLASELSPFLSKG